MNAPKLLLGVLAGRMDSIGSQAKLSKNEIKSAEYPEIKNLNL